MRCNYCGNKIRKGDKFCMQCGMRVTLQNAIGLYPYAQIGRGNPININPIDYNSYIDYNQSKEIKSEKRKKEDQLTQMIYTPSLPMYFNKPSNDLDVTGQESFNPYTQMSHPIGLASMDVQYQSKKEWEKVQKNTDAKKAFWYSILPGLLYIIFVFISNFLDHILFSSHLIEVCYYIADRFLYSFVYLSPVLALMAAKRGLKKAKRLNGKARDCLPLRLFLLV